MYQLSIMLFSMMLSIAFTQISHPLAMTLVIIIQTVLICLMSGIITQTFWFSYILFLIFLGGMLVLFIYMTSLASNELFTMPTKTILSTISMIMVIMLMCLILDSSLMLPFTLNNDMMLTNLMMISYNEASMSMIKLYNKPTEFITLLLVMYLFLTLIAICKITNIFKGPLRQKN